MVRGPNGRRQRYVPYDPSDVDCNVEACYLC